MGLDDLLTVFDRGKEGLVPATGDDGDDVFILSNDERVRRVVELEKLRDMVKTLSISNSPELARVAQKVGDGSRDGEPSVFYPMLLGISGIYAPSRHI